MRVVLTAMPWHGLETPSLPLDILRACAARCQGSHEVIDHNANLDWADLSGTVRVEDDDAVLDVIRLLREASALAIAVSWTASFTPGVPLWSLAHLPPPQGAAGSAAPTCSPGTAGSSSGHATTDGARGP